MSFQDKLREIDAKTAGVSGNTRSGLEAASKQGAADAASKAKSASRAGASAIDEYTSDDAVAKRAAKKAAKAKKKRKKKEFIDKVASTDPNARKYEASDKGQVIKGIMTQFDAQQKGDSQVPTDPAGGALYSTNRFGIPEVLKKK